MAFSITDHARNYRLVVPVGEKLINYDVKGQVVDGWDYKPTGAHVITQPQHFAIAGKDVIVVETEEGHLLQLNRRGETRFETIKGLPGLHIPFYLKEGKSLTQSEMITIADDGKLYAIHPGGPADNLYIDKQYPADYFLYFDDKYILASAENLMVKSDELPWRRELDGDITSRPSGHDFS
ncbi:MAG: hypothetical protein U5L96_20600 [Owenweeksia sp.]|nr:hypothetical protein [Owenweeksia sp.]